MRRALYAAAIVFFLAPLIAHAQAKETPLAEGRRALTVRGERYGVLADADPVTVGIREIFQKIVRAAGRRPGLAPEIHVLDTPRFMAEALPGGIVVVSRGFVGLARSDDSAMAFILGHEVAHLVRDHHGLLAGPLPDGPPSPADQKHMYQTIELDADRLGVLFAALAGYRASAAIPVLVELAARAEPDPLHPSPRERASAIRAQITAISEHLEVFYLGLFLLGAGRYLEAARVLEHFQALFPSREVMSTVGVAYHKEALRYAPEPEFRHLLMIDSSTRAPTTKGAAPHPAFKKFMEVAVPYYALATAADPGYAPAWNNLGAAHLDLGERDLALGYINRALNADPGLASAYNNRAIAMLMAEDYKRAEEDLLHAWHLAPAPNVAHNLVRLYERQRKRGEVYRWKTRWETPPRSDDGAKEYAPESIGSISPGMALNRLKEWLSEPGARQIRLPLGGKADAELTLLVLSQRGVAALARNNVVEAVGALQTGRIASAHGVRPGDASARVEAVYGRPTGLDGIQALNVWGYPARGLAVFLVDDRVQTIWAGRPARNGR